jgi:hypothetical protein
MAIMAIMAIMDVALKVPKYITKKIDERIRVGSLPAATGLNIQFQMIYIHMLSYV